MTTPVLQQQLEERIHRELSHLTAEDRCVLVCIIKRLVEVYQPDRIYLFGSKARGDAGPDSDYDILVLVEQPTEPLYRLSQCGFRALRGIAAAVDVVVWDRATFDARLHLPASFPATVEREGRLLHVA
jgi:predicted nucleotidyltransferase